jgi:parvulin-like peptidyl-prolyl isomerase
MNPFLRRLVIPLLAIGAGAGLLEAKIIDRTVATVNNVPIMLSEFEKNATPILEQFKQSTPIEQQTPERVADIKKKVLDQMIDDRLLTQQAKSLGVRVSKLEVDDGIKKVRSRFATDEEFNKELQKDGLNYDEFRNHISDQISVIKLIDQEVKAKTTPPTEADAKQLYDTLVAILHNQPVPGSHTAAEIDELQSLAKALQHRFGERVRARHILIRVDPHASEAERSAALKKIQDIQSQLKNGADFSELAKKYSQDPGSASRGGDLGYFTKGDMVPSFEKAAFSLDVGQTSDIVKTDFGYHIIHVDEKKAESKFGFDEVKDDLREYLFQQRAAKKFEEYVKDLRSKAAIKINDLS